MSFIHQIEPYITEAEVEAVSEYLRSGAWLTEFKQTETFESMIAEYLGVEHAVVVTSGTVALYLSLLALGIGPDDSVIVPNYTMIASPNSVRWTGAEVILSEIHPETMCLDLDKIKLKSNTKALMYVPINGRSGNMDQVVEYCKSNNLKLLEDSCQAMGSTWDNRFLGTWGEIGVFSFTPHKIVTTGQGGVAVTNDSELYSKLKKLKDFHRVQPGVDKHDGMGYNFKFTDVQSVIGIEQLRKIEFSLEKKKANFKAYQAAWDTIDFIDTFPTDLSQTAPWFVDILLKDIDRNDFVKYLKANHIGSRPFYSAINRQQPYASDSNEFNITHDLAERGLWLPSSVGLSDGDISKIIDIIRSYSN